MEIIPKETPKVPPWLDILFYLSVGLLIFVFISYFLVIQAIKASQKTQGETEAKLASDASNNSELENEILTYQKKINHFSGVIKGQLETSNIFGLIEKQCHPSVWFNNFSFDARGGGVVLSGEAQDFQALGQQMLIFRGEEMIKNVNLASIQIKEGGKIGFNLSLSFDPSIFIFK